MIGITFYFIILSHRAFGAIKYYFYNKILISVSMENYTLYGMTGSCLTDNFTMYFPLMLCLLNGGGVHGTTHILIVFVTDL